MQSIYPVLRAGAFACAITTVLTTACQQPHASVSFHETNTTNESLVAGAQTITGMSLGQKQLALTFDDGPGQRTEELSSYLKTEGIEAVFFVNGRKLARPKSPLVQNEDIVPNPSAVLAKLRADGHLIANHTTTHSDLRSQVIGANGGVVVYEELFQTDELIKAHVPSRTFLFRAPFGGYNQSVFDALKMTAMNKYVGPVYWEIGGYSEDYPRAAADWACWQGQLKNTNGTLVNGTGFATTVQCSDGYVNEIEREKRGVVLMHDPYGWAQGSTVDLVKDLVPKLKARGYTFVRADRIPQILTALGCDPTCATCAGTQNDECTTCAPGKFISASQCQTCATCANGKFASTACSNTADTLCSTCSTCPAGRYRAVACTETADTQCGTCDKACATCTGPTANDCGTCPNGSFKNGGACTVCSKCLAGQATSAPCDDSKDVICTDCAPGTFSADGGNCVPCASGTFSAEAKATSCAACGNCDDNDACTTDTCDATKGCVHKLIAANCSSASPGVADGGSSDGGSHADGGGTSSGNSPASPTPLQQPDADQSSGCNVGGHSSDFWHVVAFALASLTVRRRRS
jgi:peptidoglycan/xylan/chitin deacetylase (PgdA/CDA1 family)